MKAKKPFIRRNSIRFQLMAGFALAMTVLVLILGVSQYLNMKNSLYQSKIQLLESRIDNMDVKDLVNTNNQGALVKNADKFIEMVIGDNMSASVIDRNGNVIKSANQSEHDLSTIIKKRLITGSAISPFPDQKIDGVIKSDAELLQITVLSAGEYVNLMKRVGILDNYNKIIVDSTGVKQMLMWSKIGDLNAPVGLLQVSTTLKDVDDMLQNQLSVYLLAAFFVLLISGVFSYFIIGRTLKPLHEMTSAVENIDVNQLDLRLPENKRQIEVGRLTDSFNGMLDRLEASFHEEQLIKEKMQKFVSNASHELRTPLTSIHGFAEVLQMGAAKNPAKLALALNSILLESERLTVLVNELLMLTRLDSKLPISMSSIELGDLLRELEPQLAVIGGKRTLKLDHEDDVVLFGNQNHIKQVIINLVQNAIQHTDEETGQIGVVAQKGTTPAGEQCAILKVQDNGTGIKKEYLNEIFDRFFTSEADRARQNRADHGGYGLGLSIVKAIVDAHDGIIQVQSEYGKGTTFIIYFKNKSTQEKV